MGYNLNNDVPLGQLGSAYLDGTETFTPPTGRVIIAITMVAETKFDLLVPELPTDATFKGSVTSSTGASDINCIGTNNASGSTTVTAANGTNADKVNSSDVFPKGLTIYGRWTSVKLPSGVAAAPCTVILYFGI